MKWRGMRVDLHRTGLRGMEGGRKQAGGAPGRAGTGRAGLAGSRGGQAGRPGGGA
jgi:hypothetical protein